MKRITGAMKTWGRWRLPIDLASGYAKESIILKIDVPFVPSQSRILCLDSKECKRPECTKENLCWHCSDLAMNTRINHEWLCLSQLEKDCVWGKYAATSHVKNDGNIVTAREGAVIVKVKWARFKEAWPRGVKRINSKVGL